MGRQSAATTRIYINAAARMKRSGLRTASRSVCAREVERLKWSVDGVWGMPIESAIATSLAGQVLLHGLEP